MERAEVVIDLEANGGAYHARRCTRHRVDRGRRCGARSLHPTDHHHHHRHRKAKAAGANVVGRPLSAELVVRIDGAVDAGS